MKRAKALGVDTKAAQERLVKVKLDILLGPDDVECLKKNSGKKRHAVFRRASAVASWLGIRPPEGLNLGDLQTMLGQAGFPSPEVGYPQLFRCLDVDGRGDIGDDEVAVLQKGYRGPATVLEAVNFVSTMFKGFKSIEDVATHLYPNLNSLTLGLFKFTQKLAEKVDKSLLSTEKVAGIIKLLDFRGRDGRLGKQEVLSLNNLQGLLAYVNIKTVCSAMESKYGSLDAAFGKHGSKKSGSMTLDDFSNAARKLGKFQSPEVVAMYMLLAKDASSPISKAEFGAMTSLPGVLHVLEDLHKLHEILHERFENSANVVDDSFQFILERENASSEAQRRASKRGSVQSSKIATSVAGGPSGGISCGSFEAASEEWGFTPSVLTLQQVFNLFDLPRQGSISADHWRLLDFFQAEELRCAVGHLKDFLIKQDGSCEAAFQRMSVQKRMEKKKAGKEAQKVKQ